MSKTGINLIAEERERQIEQEGYDLEHDDLHVEGELAIAGGVYALTGSNLNKWVLDMVWPWGHDTFKPKSRKENLIRAGALIAAELDRLARDEKLMRQDSKSSTEDYDDIPF